MKVEDIMTYPAVYARPEETVRQVADRLAGLDIGAMPVCGENGHLLGMVTDRDLVTRCMAKGKIPEETAVEDIMTKEPAAVNMGMDALLAAGLMGRKQVRRLPVLQNGMLRGMLSLSDIAAVESIDAGDALARITKDEEFF